jgi:cystathionine beta-lyase family protein involved in aluminum resistance
LSWLKRFRKKEEETLVETARTTASELQQICGNDNETYEALYHTMFLDPRKVGISMKQATENAEKLENEKNLDSAKIWYDIAGGLAIYEGNTKKVAEFFSESERISGMKYPSGESCSHGTGILREAH